MECFKIQKIIPGYIRHLASAEQIALIEEHLCLCNDCRQALATMMDELEDVSKKPAAAISDASLNIDDSEFKVENNDSVTVPILPKEKIVSQADQPVQPAVEKYDIKISDTEKIEKQEAGDGSKALVAEAETLHLLDKVAIFLGVGVTIIFLFLIFKK